MNLTEDEFYQKICQPIYNTNFFVWLSLIFNTLLSSMVHYAPPNFLLLIAFYVGFAYQLLVALLDVFEFWIFTIFLFMAFFCVALIIRRILGWRCYHVLKFLIFINALFCFKPHMHKSHVEEFVFIYIGLSIKLLSAADKMQAKGNILLKNGTLLSYMTYTPCILFRHFLALTENYSSWKNTAWWYMVSTGWPRAIVYNILAHNIVDDDFLPNIFFRPQAIFIIQTFQYRCYYYFLAQIGELQLLAAGVQKANWFVNHICAPLNTELSTTIVNFVRELNRPATMFFLSRIQRKNKTILEKLEVPIDLIMVLTAVLCYDANYAFLCALFVAVMGLEQLALFQAEARTGVCVYTCPGVFCIHLVQKGNQILYLYIKSMLWVYNKYCISLLFVKGAAIASSVESLCYILIADATVLILMFLLKFVQK